MRLKLTILFCFIQSAIFAQRKDKWEVLKEHFKEKGSTQSVSAKKIQKIQTDFLGNEKTWRAQIHKRYPEILLGIDPLDTLENHIKITEGQLHSVARAFASPNPHDIINGIQELERIGLFTHEPINANGASTSQEGRGQKYYVFDNGEKKNARVDFKKQFEKANRGTVVYQEMLHSHKVSKLVLDRLDQMFGLSFKPQSNHVKRILDASFAAWVGESQKPSFLFSSTDHWVVDTTFQKKQLPILKSALGENIENMKLITFKDIASKGRGDSGLPGVKFNQVKKFAIRSDALPPPISPRDLPSNSLQSFPLNNAVDSNLVRLGLKPIEFKSSNGNVYKTIPIQTSAQDKLWRFQVFRNGAPVTEIQIKNLPNLVRPSEQSNMIARVNGYVKESINHLGNLRRTNRPVPKSLHLRLEGESYRRREVFHEPNTLCRRSGICSAKPNKVPRDTSKHQYKTLGQDIKVEARIQSKRLFDQLRTAMKSIYKNQKLASLVPIIQSTKRVGNVDHVLFIDKTNPKRYVTVKAKTNIFSKMKNHLSHSFKGTTFRARVPKLATVNTVGGTSLTYFYLFKVIQDFSQSGEEREESLSRLSVGMRTAVEIQRWMSVVQLSTAVSMDALKVTAIAAAKFGVAKIGLTTVGKYLGPLSVALDVVSVATSAYQLANAKNDAERVIYGAQLGVSVVGLLVSTASLVALAAGATAVFATLAIIALPIALIGIGVMLLAGSVSEKMDQIDKVIEFFDSMQQTYSGSPLDHDKEQDVLIPKSNIPFKMFDFESNSVDLDGPYMYPSSVKVRRHRSSQRTITEVAVINTSKTAAFSIPDELGIQTKKIQVEAMNSGKAIILPTIPKTYVSYSWATRWWPSSTYSKALQKLQQKGKVSYVYGGIDKIINELKHEYADTEIKIRIGTKDVKPVLLMSDFTETEEKAFYSAITKHLTYTFIGAGGSCTLKASPGYKINIVEEGKSSSTWNILANDVDAQAVNLEKQTLIFPTFKINIKNPEKSRFIFTFQHGTLVSLFNGQWKILQQNSEAGAKIDQTNKLIALAKKNKLANQIVPVRNHHVSGKKVGTAYFLPAEARWFYIQDRPQVLDSAYLVGYSSNLSYFWNTEDMKLLVSDSSHHLSQQIQFRLNKAFKIQSPSLVMNGDTLRIQTRVHYEPNQPAWGFMFTHNNFALQLAGLGIIPRELERVKAGNLEVLEFILSTLGFLKSTILKRESETVNEKLKVQFADILLIYEDKEQPSNQDVSKVNNVEATNSIEKLWYRKRDKKVIWATNCTDGANVTKSLNYVGSLKNDANDAERFFYYSLSTRRIYVQNDWKKDEDVPIARRVELQNVQHVSINSEGKLIARADNALYQVSYDSVQPIALHYEWFQPEENKLEDLRSLTAQSLKDSITIVGLQQDIGTFQKHPMPAWFFFDHNRTVVGNTFAVQKTRVIGFGRESIYALIQDIDSGRLYRIQSYDFDSFQTKIKEKEPLFAQPEEIPNLTQIIQVAEQEGKFLVITKGGYYYNLDIDNDIIVNLVIKDFKEEPFPVPPGSYLTKYRRMSTKKEPIQIILKSGTSWYETRQGILYPGSTIGHTFLGYHQPSSSKVQSHALYIYDKSTTILQSVDQQGVKTIWNDVYTTKESDELMMSINSTTDISQVLIENINYLGINVGNQVKKITITQQQCATYKSISLFFEDYSQRQEASEDSATVLSLPEVTFSGVTIPIHDDDLVIAQKECTITLKHTLSKPFYSKNLRVEFSDRKLDISQLRNETNTVDPWGPYVLECEQNPSICLNSKFIGKYAKDDDDDDDDGLFLDNASSEEVTISDADSQQS